MGVEVQFFEFGLTPLDFRPWGWIRSEVYKQKINTTDELVACIIMSSDALIKQECLENLRKATCTVSKRVGKCIEVNGGIFEHLL
jgi:hypothetical protein